MKLGRAPTTKQTWCEGMTLSGSSSESARVDECPPPRAHAEIVLDSLAHPRELRLADARVQRKRQAFTRERLGHGEIARAKAEVPVCRRQMRGMGVVPPGLDAPICEEGRERLRLRRPDNVEMPDWVAPRGLLRKAEAEPLHLRQSVRVELRRGLTLSVPPFEQGEFLEQDDRLDGVEPGGVADVLMVVLVRLAVDTKRQRMLGQRLVVGHERARVSHRAEVLSRVKAEGCRSSHARGGRAVAASPVRLARVLDDLEAVSFSDGRK